MMNAGIKGISYYLPSRIFTNDEYFEKFPELRENTNLKKVGVTERRIVAPDEFASDLAIAAGKKFFDEHPEVKRDDIDFLLYCAQERDYYTPHTGTFLVRELELGTQCGSLDFNLGCSGFVYGLSLAKGLIESVGNKNVLFLTSSVLTKTFHPKDKASHFLFGDAGAATLISGSAGGAIGGFIQGTDGKGLEKIILKHRSDRHSFNNEIAINETMDEYGNITSDAHFFMDGTGVFLFSIKKVPELMLQTLQKNNLQLNDIDLFILHQANAFILETIRKKLDISSDKFLIHIENTGNTVSCSIPIALHHAIKTGKAKKGNKILVAGFGVGLSWSCTILTL